MLEYIAILIPNHVESLLVILHGIRGLRMVLVVGVRI